MTIMLSGNKFWYMEKRPIPERADYSRAGVNIPTSGALVEKTTGIERSRVTDPNNEFADSSLCPK
jgi:hypothetical protein